MLAFLISTSGCTTSNLTPIKDEVDRAGTGLNEETGQSIDGYLLVDGTRGEFNGWARIVEPDSIKFWGQKIESDPFDPIESTTIEVPGYIHSLDAVKALDVVTTNSGKSVAFAFGIVLGILGLLAIGMAASEWNFAE